MGGADGQTPGDASVWGWLEPVHPDDRARVRELWTKSLQEGHPDEISYRVKDP